MLVRHLVASGLIAGLLSLLAADAFSASDATTGKPVGEKSAESEIARYCGNVAPSAAEARLAWQMKRLAEMETHVRQALDELGKREDETREWVLKREQITRAATDDLVGIYSKMSAESAAAELAAMDDVLAASVLMKLKPQAAAVILNEMDPDHAGHLTTMMAGGVLGTGKS